MPVGGGSGFMGKEVAWDIPLATSWSLATGAAALSAVSTGRGRGALVR